MVVSLSPTGHACHPCLPGNLGRFPRGTEGAEPSSNELLRSFPISEFLFLAPCTQVKSLFLWPWASYLPWVCLSHKVFSVNKMKTLIGLTSSGHCETCVNQHMYRAQSDTRNTNSALGLHWDSSDYKNDHIICS